MDGVARNIMKPPTLSASSHDSFNHPFGEAIIYVQRDPTDEVDDDEDELVVVGWHGANSFVWRMARKLLMNLLFGVVGGK